MSFFLEMKCIYDKTLENTISLTNCDSKNIFEQRKKQMNIRTRKI